MCAPCLQLVDIMFGTEADADFVTEAGAGIRISLGAFPFAR